MFLQLKYPRCVINQSQQEAYTFSQSDSVGGLATARMQAKRKMESLLHGVGITCAEMGTITSNMSSGPWDELLKRTDHTGKNEVTGKLGGSPQ